MRHLLYSICAFIGLLLSIKLSAHDLRLNNIPPATWHLTNGESFQGYYLYRNGDDIIWDDAEHHTTRSFPLSSLSAEDQARIPITPKTTSTTYKSHQSNLEISFTDRWQLILFLSLGLLCLGMMIWMHRGANPRFGIYMPILLVILGLSGMSMSLKKPLSSMLQNDPLIMNEAFAPFVPNINTLWNDTYFYVESQGIPATHEMMVGISNHGWQQQVPIPQCYIGNNAWPIPLNPVISDNPIPVDEIHFTRGAIAIAVNGVPIFNYHTNTGVDSYLDGQLDLYGGHCGRADDYHYHIAPLHLYNYTSSALPIAYGLDGFAVYGELEPDGSAMQTLDENHGHWFNGEYHYHGTSEAPYMIARMAGVVTEDSTHQLIPQAAAHPVRPSLTPLNGALITSCTPNLSANGYNLSYTLQGQTDSVVYSWTPNGVYTFQFYTAGNGTCTTETHNGFTPCSVPTVIHEMNHKDGYVYPNPTNNVLMLPFQYQQNVTVRIYNLQGKLVYSSFHSQGPLDVSSLNPGAYILQVGDALRSQNCQFIKQ